MAAGKAENPKGGKEVKLENSETPLIKDLPAGDTYNSNTTKGNHGSITRMSISTIVDNEIWVYFVTVDGDGDAVVDPHHTKAPGEMVNGKNSGVSPEISEKMKISLDVASAKRK